MNIERLLSGESKNVEYKVSRPEKSIRYMKSVVAFANTSGGDCFRKTASILYQGRWRD